MSTAVVLIHQLWPAVLGAGAVLTATYLSLRGISGRGEPKPEVLVELPRDDRTRTITS